MNNKTRIQHKPKTRLTAAWLLVVFLMFSIVLVSVSAAQDETEPVATGTIVFQAVSGGPIYAVDPDGGNLRYLTDGMDPSLSPDGQQVAFTRWDDSQHGSLGSLWLINIDGTGERMVLGEVNQPKSPVWSPDGSRIALAMQQGGRLDYEMKCGSAIPSDPLAADENGDYYRVVVNASEGDVDIKFCYTLLPHPNWSLRVVDVESGSFEDLPGGRFSRSPAWDPANDWHLVFAGEGGMANLDINQGTSWPLTDDPKDYTPDFSPDGSHIAVSHWQHDHWEVHTMNADGGGRVRLTETPLRILVEQKIEGQEAHSWNNVSPIWSPDGSQIAFLTDRTGQWEVWIMNADGSHQHPLFPAGTTEELGLEHFGVGERSLSWR